MPRTLFTADTHFGHRSIVSAKFDHPRPFATIEAHDEALIAAWNAVVRPDDIVWHLGDFAYKCGLDYGAGILSRLNGRKHLVRGNHDVGLGDRLDCDAPVVDVTRVQVQDPSMATPRQVWVSHYAHRTWPNARRGDLHLYGHSHGGLPPIEGSLDVGVDCWDWRPVTLARVGERLAGLFPPETEPEPLPKPMTSGAKAEG